MLGLKLLVAVVCGPDPGKGVTQQFASTSPSADHHQARSLREDQQNELAPT